MLKKVFNGVFLKRLDNIIQWQDKDVIFKESVSSHSYKVSVFCTLILDEIFGEENNKEDVVNFKLRCIKHAIYHDWDEALIMRDISHETKYNSFNGEEIRACLNNLSKEFSKREFLNEGKIKTVYNAMNESNEAVHAVVKFCDWLAMIFYLRREESLGNKTLTKQKEYSYGSIVDAYSTMRIKINGYFGSDVVKDLNWGGIIEFLKMFKIELKLEEND